MDTSNTGATQGQQLALAHRSHRGAGGPQILFSPEIPTGRGGFCPCTLAARTLRGSKSFSEVNFGSSSKGSVKLWANVFGTGQENTLEAALVKKWSYDGYTGAVLGNPGRLLRGCRVGPGRQQRPSVANGWAYVGFQYADEGAIYYCDNVVEMLKKNGVYDDYLGNGAYFTALRNKEGQVGIPWGVDTRIFWYNEPLLKRPAPSRRPTGRPIWPLAKL